jgi:hypothetical protein
VPTFPKRVPSSAPSVEGGSVLPRTRFHFVALPRPSSEGMSVPHVRTTAEYMSSVYLLHTRPLAVWFVAWHAGCWRRRVVHLDKPAARRVASHVQCKSWHQRRIGLCSCFLFRADERAGGSRSNASRAGLLSLCLACIWNDCRIQCPMCMSLDRRGNKQTHV